MTATHLWLRPAIFVTVGALLAAAHFTVLRYNAELYLTGGRCARAIGLHALRTALVVGAWLAIARFGAVALLSAFAGLWIARSVVPVLCRSAS